MAEAGNRQIRLSQTIVPFGVGAIYDIFGESFAACDTYMWGAMGEHISSEALRRKLGVGGLRSAEAYQPGRRGIPYIRFPHWLFCQRCRGLIDWKIGSEERGEPARCLSCHRQLVPMRFIVVCENGHMADVPWHIWAHSSKSKNKSCRSHNLEYRTVPNRGAGLNASEIRCKDCNSSRSLAGISSKDSLSLLNLHCSGRQPWQRLDVEEQCQAQPMVVQRGASNVYFANVQSALDIPTAESHSAFGEATLKVQAHVSYPMLLRLIDTPGPFLQQTLEWIAHDTELSEDDVAAVAKAATTDDRSTDGETIDIALNEWLALRKEQPESDDRSPFMTRQATLFTSASSDRERKALRAIEKVVLVTRLKEVRALDAFSRYTPGGRELRPDLTVDEVHEKRRVNWLPAAEVYGEGIFVEFNETVLHEWEQRRGVLERAARIREHVDSSDLASAILSRRLGGREISPRLIFLHTFAHLLIRELCFDCGYSSASLSERVYCRSNTSGVPQAGILIYTAAGDSEGTLGGLVRQGEAPRLRGSIFRALESALWCSTDPICRESEGQGYDKTNLAACHACSLLPETSCSFGNMLLDRSLVVSPSDDAMTALFDDPMATLGSMSTSP